MDYDEVIDEMNEYGPESDQLSLASFQTALECVNFAQNVTEFLQHLGRVAEEDCPSPDALMSHLERLNNELSGAIVFLSTLDSNGFDVVKALRTSSETLQKTPDGGEVAETIADSYGKLADLVDTVVSVKRYQDQQVQ